MTACAHRVVAMRLQTLADRGGFPSLSTLRQSGDVGRRSRGRGAKEIGHDPFSAEHRRCAIRIRRHCQQAALAQETGTPAQLIATECDATKVRPVDIWNAVV